MSYFVEHLGIDASVYYQANINLEKSLWFIALSFDLNMLEVVKQKECMWFVYSFKLQFVIFLTMFC